jgi:hypothetical protein
MLVTVLPSHVGDDAAEATWSRHDVDAESCWRQRYRGNLATARCRCQVMLATVLLSHAGDGAAGVTWSWHDLDVESCWRWRCQGDSANESCW